MRGRTTDRELAALNAVLGDDAPEGLRSLSAAHLADLAEAVAAARRRQGEALAASGERALDHIPRLLRAPVRRIVG